MKFSMEKWRKEYKSSSYKEPLQEPFLQFAAWLHEASLAKESEPNAMVLATVSSLGQPSTRSVLLKGFDKKGFVFYTHYNSRKGQQIEENDHVSLLFLWKKLDRQVSIEGKATKISHKESAKYFAKRPRGAKLSALISAQSEPLASRDALTQLFSLKEKEYRGKEIPCPKTWGGYLVKPHRIEFWQGRKNRLHDRFLYIRVNNSWVLSRLYP